MPARKKIIDLFCGAGGFSLGAHMAGFETALAVDIDPVLTSSFTDNFPKTKRLLADIGSLSGTRLLNEAKLKKGEVAGIIGGPPCQGFSLMGKREASDPRNELIGHFFRLINEVQPDFFVMENVPGLLLGKSRLVLDGAIKILDSYEILGPISVNASEYGAATNRERVLVIGFRNGQKIDEQALRPKVCIKSTVRSAISDLPSPKIKGWGTYAKKLELSAYAKKARKTCIGLGKKDYKQATEEGMVSGLLPTVHSIDVVSRFSMVEQGKTDLVSRCPRLKWDALAPTLRAGTGPDHGGFQSIRPIHPVQNRVITVREAARLQGFPDWFKFHETKWHSFRMIGNSVSPLLAHGVLSKTMSLLSVD